MPEELKLLPCPACGYNAYLKEESSSFGIKAYSVCCRGCELITGLSRTKEQTIARWNALPRALRWTNEPPRGPGWYWYRNCDNDNVKIMHITSIPFGIVSGSQSYAGPIPEPRPREPQEEQEKNDA